MRLIFVLDVTSETEIAQVANGVYCWHTKSWRGH